MKEKDFYSTLGNWDFSQIKLKTRKLTDWDFFKEITKYTDENSVCLDLGTAAGEKLLAKYPKVKIVYGTDYSEEMVTNAKENLKKSERKDVTFSKMDNLKIEFPDNTFDVISARHTVINASELQRALKPGGMVIIQGVDKDDCIEIKNLFGRGQAYLDEESISTVDYNNLVSAGFKIIKKVRIIEEEYFQTKEDLMALLLKTPILDNFSETTGVYEKREIERDLFEKYVDKYQTSEGILLNRVLYGIVAQK